MKKTSLTERFQELAGIKPLTEQPKMRDLGDLQSNPDKYRDEGNPYSDYYKFDAFGNLITKYNRPKDDKKISADAEKLANSPILNQINTRDEWEDAMDVLMKKADDINQVSDSVKRTWLQNALKAI